jgi:hypothetical protein
MSKFSYHGGNERDWEGLSHQTLRGQIIVKAQCECGESEIIESGRPLPPEQFAKKFKAKGWALGRRMACPKCRSAPERKEPQKMPEPDREPAQPSDAARTQRRMIYIALEAAYDESARHYKAGHSDETIAKEVGCAANAVRIVREEFFGPAQPPEPPEIAQLRADLASALETSRAYRAEADRMVAQASALEGHVQSLSDRLDRWAKAQGWQ